MPDIPEAARILLGLLLVVHVLAALAAKAEGAVSHLSIAGWTGFGPDPRLAEERARPGSRLPPVPAAADLGRFPLMLPRLSVPVTRDFQEPGPELTSIRYSRRP